MASIERSWSYCMMEERTEDGGGGSLSSFVGTCQIVFSFPFPIRYIPKGDKYCCAWSAILDPFSDICAAKPGPCRSKRGY